MELVIKLGTAVTYIILLIKGATRGWPTFFHKWAKNFKTFLCKGEVVHSLHQQILKQTRNMIFSAIINFIKMCLLSLTLIITYKKLTISNWKLILRLEGLTLRSSNSLLRLYVWSVDLKKIFNCLLVFEWSFNTNFSYASVTLLVRIFQSGNWILAQLKNKIRSHKK